MRCRCMGGALAAVDPAEAQPRRGARHRAHLLGDRPVAHGYADGQSATLPFAAPHDQQRQAGGRWTPAAAGGDPHLRWGRCQPDPSWGAVSGRIAGVWAQKPGNATSAAGRQSRDHQPRAGSAPLSPSLQRHLPIVPHRLRVEARQHVRWCQQPDVVHSGPALYIIGKT